MTKGLAVLFAFCCGAIVANIYYAQPIIGLIAPDIGLSSTLASFIVSLTQIGYALGLFFWCRWVICWKTAS
jgi:MFS family permease